MTEVNYNNHFIDFKAYTVKPDEEYMSTAMRAHFRAILTNWRNQLMAEVDATVNNLKGDSPSNYADPIDQAVKELDFSLELRVRDRERKLIKKIEKSIEDLERGDYGYCKSCGIEIGVQRLEARPTAELYIDCKTYFEEKNRSS